MHLKLIQAIRANGQQHRPPAVVDTQAIGVSDTEAEVLVRSGVASIVEPEPDTEAEVAAAEAAADAAIETLKAQAEAITQAAAAKPAKKR